jgi:7-cyano-7-deazaguanine synthase in queuosine biosynthesis
MDGQNKTKRILLLSGGADSILLSQTLEFDILLFIHYGQGHLALERDKALPYLTHEMDLGIFVKEGKQVNCRNMTFVMEVVSRFGDCPLEIFLGTNKEDKYADNNREFYDNLELFVNKISLHPVKVKTPLINLTKQEILSELKRDFYTD